MRPDVRKYVGSCHLCLCTKAVRTTRPDCLRPRAAKAPWKNIALDLMGPYLKSTAEKSFILVVTDLFSRWIEAFPIGSSRVYVLVNLLEREVFPRWGYPRQILSDNGKQFTGHTHRISPCNRTVEAGN
ncbi:protein NYNRIN-like [Belonocnema kinseyi]|uniref:protein NYNRIN-like n=1 Tax=Belonocnema kinseyi TaxID=2817044 RepID=UPI00143D9A16|nr:protein NYNRIN-like [Belonocnema kinseyi]